MVFKLSSSHHSSQHDAAHKMWERTYGDSYVERYYPKCFVNISSDFVIEFPVDTYSMLASNEHYLQMDEQNPLDIQ